MEFRLKNICENYMEGCVEYYENCKPNQWQEAFDVLDKSIESQDVYHISNTAVWFETELMRLLKHYKTLQKQIEIVFGGNK